MGQLLFFGSSLVIFPCLYDVVLFINCSLHCFTVQVEEVIIMSKSVEGFVNFMVFWKL